MDMESLKLAFQILQFLATGAVGTYVYMANKDTVTNERIKKLEDDLDGKLDGQGERIAKLEQRADGAPTHRDLGDIYDKLGSVDGGLKELTGAFNATRPILQLIHETLMVSK